MYALIDKSRTWGVNRSWIVYTGVLSAALLWVSLILLAPWFWAEGRTLPAGFIYGGFSAVCHQISDRSFHLWGRQLGVCSRCTGIYAGFAAGALLYPLVRRLGETRFPSRSILLFSMIPISVDFALGFLGLWANTFLSRTLTGLLFGVIVAFYIIPGFVAAFSVSRSENQAGS
jgi:uncharacterized membrane protein